MAKAIKSNREQVDRIVTALRAGEFAINEGRLNVILRYLEPKLDETGTTLTQSEIIEKVIDDFEADGGVLEEETPTKKVYRKRSDLPAPDKKADAEVNRLKKQFKIRVLPELQERVDAAAKEAGLTRQEWVEQLLTEALVNK